jgi:AraC-like DNA-binding protein
VSTIGFMPGKASRVDWTFHTLNFSFILAGAGTYLWRGRILRVESPAVIQQFPGEKMDYGPDAGTTWREVYVVYDARCAPRLRSAGHYRPDRPLWAIANAGPVLRAAAEREGDGPVDRIDRIAERMVYESLVGGAPDAADRAASTIAGIQSLARADPGLPHDFEALARRRGLSLTSFRRHWLARVGMPPARWLRGVRMREACRLLAETRLPIGEIARRVGFDDELYFSRRFHADRGMTATAYRRTFSGPHISSAAELMQQSR